MHKVLSSLLTMGLLFQPGLSAPRSSTLSLAAQPVKRAFSAGEAVRYILKLRNTGQSSLFVDRLLIPGDTIQIAVKSGPAKTTYCGKLHARTYATSDFALLKPGETITIEQEISCTDQKNHSGLVLAPGEYQLQFTYKINSKYVAPFANGAAIPAGPIRSGVSEVTIERGD